MTIVVSGGGSGGHITPILAVAHELKRQQAHCRVIYIGEHGGKFMSLAHDNPDIDEVYAVYAGKFRRYHGESWLVRLFDIRTNSKNIRDVLYVIIGIFQALRLLRKLRPDVVFLKGGYVGVPVGLAAAFRHVPFLTHDSDALPGLANRLTGRWAQYHATGMPAEYYSYAPASIRYTGVLVGAQFQLVTDELKRTYRDELQLPNDAVVVLVTGGSLGAQRLNDAFRKIESRILSAYPNVWIIHQVGKNNLDYSTKHERVLELEFMEGMYRYTGAADIVVTRAGANTLAELGVQAKACVVVPNPLLTAGHQLRNAEYLVSQNAVIAVDEATFTEDESKLANAVIQLLDSEQKRQQLASSLHSLIKPHAAQELADLLISIAAKQD